MSSTKTNVDYMVEQMSAAGQIVAKPMFGEYGVYCDGKIVALICDDQLFVKPTAEGRRHCVGCAESPAYPGAKPSLLIDAERIEDRDWLSALIKITAAALPAPKPKVKKPKK